MNQIDYEKRSEIYRAAFEKWGMEAQMWVAVEEMAELTKELCKARRGKQDAQAVADEIADVTIMLEQLRLMFGINDMVCERMDFKLRRLSCRVGDVLDKSGLVTQTTLPD